MAKKVVSTKAGKMVQWTIYIPLPIYEAFESKARDTFKTPAEAARDAFREYTEKKQK